MDPDVALEDLLELVRQHRDGGEVSPEDTEHHLDLICNEVEALDGWLNRGGFLPRRWTAASSPSGR